MIASVVEQEVPEERTGQLEPVEKLRTYNRLDYVH